jgi:hypothetical protein
MSANIPPVPHRSQIIGPDGYATPVWADWFQKITANALGNGSTTAITALTGDVTAIGPGGVTATIAAGAITDAKVSSSAAIARSKIATGSADHVVINSGTGALSSEANLAVSRGGTNSGTTLNNNRVMVSSTSKIVEASAITASRALVSDVNGIPTHSSVTDTELGYVSGVTSGIQSQINGKQTTALTNGKILIGSGSSLAAEQSVTGDISLTNVGVTAYSGTVPLNKGGTGQTTKAPAFDALQPMTTLGDTIYGGASGTGTRLAGNITTTKKFKTQTGDGVNSAAPAWGTIAATDLSGITNTQIDAAAAIVHTKLANITAASVLMGNASNIPTATAITGDISLTSSGVTAYSGTVPLLKGGTGQTTKAAAFDALSPMSASGDIIYGGASGTGTRLPKGSDGQVCTLASGLPSWASVTVSGLNITPQGRLTLSSTLPVMTADATAQTSVYYLPYVGNVVPIYDGSVMQIKTIGAGLTMTLNTSNQLSGKVYDLFVFLNSGTVTIGAGPAWSSTTSRGTGAGTTELQLINGTWSNKVSIDLKNSSTTYSAITANQATYVGSVYCTANGQTGMTFKPSAASGGSNGILAVYNAYNRIRCFSVSRDSNTAYTYATATWRSMDNNANNRVTWLDGLQQTPVRSILTQAISSNTLDAVSFIGTNLDATSGAPGVQAEFQCARVSVYAQPTASENFAPQIGLHFVQAMEFVNSGTSTFSGSSGSLQSLTLETEH